MLLIALVGVFAVGAFSQDHITEEYLDRTLEANRTLLDSEVSTVVESAIYNVIVFKENYPNKDYGNVIESLKALVNDGKTVKLRYIAQLASLYFEYPDLFMGIEFEKSAEDTDFYFKEMSDLLVKKSLVMN
jgi:hypothetical protein